MFGFLFFTFVCAVPEDLSITRIAGLTWEQWNARLALPLLAQLREGAQSLMFPTDLSVNASSEKMGGGASSQSSLSPDKQHSPVDGSIGGAGYPCSECGRSYKLKSSLRNHQKWECGKDPQFQCPFCIYRAKQKMHIGRHMERMHKEKFLKIEGDHVIAMRDEDGNTTTINMNSC